MGLFKFQHYKKRKTLLSMFSSKIKLTQPSTFTYVYRIRCEDCNSLYIGETGWPFSVRLKEHIANSIKHKNYSAIVDHCRTKLKFDFDHSVIVFSENHQRKRNVAKALFIRNSSTISGNISQNLFLFKDWLVSIEIFLLTFCPVAVTGQRFMLILR